MTQRGYAQGLVREAAPFARVVQHLWRIPQARLIPVGRRLQQAAQHICARSLLALLVALTAHFNARLAPEFLQRLAERPTMMLLGKGEEVAAFGAAAEATPALGVRIDDEGGRLFAVEGTVGLVVAPAFFSGTCC